MSEAHDGPRNRYLPYGPRPNRTANIHITVRRDLPAPERSSGGSGGGGGGRSQDASRRNWFKITIPYGKKYDKTWLLSSIQNLCSVPFTPVEFHYDHNRAQFYVEDATTASALKQVSRKITDRDNYKVVIIINSSAPPQSLQNELKPEEIEQLKLCMSKRYDGSQRALDLKSLRVDPDLVSQSIDVVLNQRSCMLVVLRIIEENIPELQSLNLSSNKLYRLDDLAELAQKAAGLKILDLSRNELKSERDLDKVKGLKLEELWLDGNPLCDAFRDQATYVRSVAVGGISAAPVRPGGVGGAPPTIPWGVTAAPGSFQGSYFGSDDLKALVLRFLQQYYSIYDSSDRQGLLDAYHDGACCSLSIPFGHQNPPSALLLSPPAMRFKLLKHTRLNVVAFLNELPKTQHDVNSFVVDVCAQTNTLLCFAVHGIFKEGEGREGLLLRPWPPFLCLFPPPSLLLSLCIVNDELFVRNATTEEIRKAFVMPAPTPSSSPVPTLSAEQQEMLAAFSMQSGMNLEWSQKCLQDNDWDYGQAGQVFTQLKLEGKIPEVAFLK
uniref:Nuclear RNA export factor 1 n=1 Tax=Anas zonorhyncha TaxID=75864 RepID=A0A8B9ZYX4_9AVES